MPAIPTIAEISRRPFVSPRFSYDRVPATKFPRLARYRLLPAFIVNFCLKTGPHGRKPRPAPFAALPCKGIDGRSGFVRADRNHKAGNDAGLTEKETTMSLKNTKKNEAAETKNSPVAKVRVGLITASIWENPTEKGTFYNVT